MKLRQGGRRFTAIDLISNGLVLRRKTSKDSFNLIFMIHSLPKKSDFIKSSGETLEVIIDRFFTFLPGLNLLTNLLDMGATGFHIGRREGGSDLSRCSRRGEDQLNRRGYCTKEGAEDQTILSFP